MKTNSVIYLVAILLVSCQLSNDNTENKKKIISKMTDKSTRDNQHTIMFYNVENLFDTEDDPYTEDDEFLPHGSKKWTEKRFNTKINRLSEVIMSIDSGELPSIIGMVEIENAFVLTELVENAYLKRFNYDFIHYESPDERGIDVAFIYNKDKFKVFEHENIPVQLPRGDKTRDILLIKGKFKGDNQIFIFFVNHWPSRREGADKTEKKRIEAAETLRYHVDKVIKNDKNARIVILGDFNDYPDSPSLTNYLDAKPQTPVNPEQLFNMAYKLHETGKGSYNYKGDWVMMDQIIISGNLLENNNETYTTHKNGLKIFFEDFILYEDKKYNEMKPHKTYGGNNYFGGYSDHLPIYVTLKINSIED